MENKGQLLSWLKEESCPNDSIVTFIQTSSWSGLTKLSKEYWEKRFDDWGTFVFNELHITASIVVDDLTDRDRFRSFAADAFIRDGIMFGKEFFPYPLYNYEIKTLYVRQCYIDVFELLTGSIERGEIKFGISGTPGVGKSMFFLYIWFRVLKGESSFKPKRIITWKNNRSEREKALLNANQVIGSGDWLNVVPSVGLGLCMDSRSFRVMLKRRMGLNVYAAHSKCLECKRGENDVLGDHASICQGIMLFVISCFSWLQQAKLAPRKEVPGLLSEDGSKPADIMIPFIQGVPNQCIDVTVVSPFVESVIKKFAVEGGAAAKNACLLKRRKYEDRCRNQGLTFCTLCLETTGGMDEASCDLLTKLVQSLCHSQDHAIDSAIFHWRSRISFAVMKLTASMILRRL
ncbi:hypothetical protein ROZALSC1DRAFT_24249 [Rozella allomycis CSF55]|uniref:Uncharacterized protein n=1 Tax=Rozella allomycis (strain CSF55) TaxID=988480 RepID=A0A4P9YE05_ROZAC|nr:hypothetical protein ROZALSC1DRAFT_24249 [Rozella allomycis CSF55]